VSVAASLRRWARPTGWPELATGALVLLVTAAAVFAPLPTLLVGLAAAIVWALVRWPFAIPALLIVLMGNVKVNVYLGFFTLFPEYLLLAVSSTMALLAWWARPAWPPERRATVLILIWAFTGLLSLPNALSGARVLARVVLDLVSLVTFLTMVVTLRTRDDLRRAVTLWEVVATVYAAFGIVQMIGLVAGFDTSLHFLKGIANPDIYQGVGAPVRRRIGDVFRANSMFNDPNILGGFLAAAMSAMLALRFHHAETGRRRRALGETLALAVMAVCMLLTQSRSGVLALLAGAGVVFAHWPGFLRRSGVWIAVAATVAATVAVAILVQVDPTLLLSRFAGTADTNDLSNRQHLDVFAYGLELLRRFPLFGAGLGNFGLYYGPERDAFFSKMMTHCAPLTYFAESGIPGGMAFCAVWWHITRRVAGARPADTDAEGRALRVALLAAIVAVLVANLFYDYILRTFVWVLAALAVSVARHHDEGAREQTA
jgi:O-antigen ligase